MEETNSKDEFDFKNRLKLIPINDIEVVVARAVGGLIGVNLKCSIKMVNYDLKGLVGSGGDFSLSLYPDLG